MQRTIVFAVSLLTCGFAWSEELTLADVKTQSAVLLSAADLKQLLSGATVVNQLPTGSTRRWKNSPNGSLEASNDGRGHTGGNTRPAFGSGAWKIDDGGAYCVDIKWASGRTEKIGVATFSR